MEATRQCGSDHLVDGEGTDEPRRQRLRLPWEIKALGGQPDSLSHLVSVCRQHLFFFFSFLILFSRQTFFFYRTLLLCHHGRSSAVC